MTAIVLLPLLLTLSLIRISKITHYISMRTVIMHPNFFIWLWRLCKIKLIECRFEKLTFPTCMNCLAFTMIVLIACNKWYIRQLLFYVWLYMCRLFESCTLEVYWFIYSLQFQTFQKKQRWFSEATFHENTFNIFNYFYLKSAS